MSLGPLIGAALKRAGERLALVDGARRWSAAALDRDAERLARALARHLSPGERVLLCMRNRAEYVLLQLALERAGLVRVPLNRLYTPNEVARVVASCRPAAAFCDTQTLERFPPAPDLWVCPMDGEDARGGPSWAALLAGQTGPLPAVGPDALCSISYTSGTSGTPKGVMMAHANWAAVYANMLADRDVRCDDVMVHVGPLTHASGAYLAPHLLRGAASVLVDMRSPKDLFAAIEEHRATLFACVPTVLTRLLASPDIDAHDLGSLRRIVHGAEPIPANTLRAALGRFGPILVQNYGLTEAMMTVAFLSETEHLHEGRPRVGCIGRPYTLVEVVLRAPGGEPVETGEVGEITIRSPHVMQGYWEMPEETDRVLKGGWLWSGDLGVREPDGMLRLVGRSKDLVISGGFNIYPAEVESFISAQPGVREVAAFGVPDPDWGERLVAFVAGDCEPSALERGAREALGIKAPKEWRTRPALPRTGNGKIDRAALKAELLGG